MNHESLARSVPHAAPGAVVALSLSGQVIQGPAEGRSIRFGRNRPHVDVCVGETDLRVSRTHGVLSYREGSWWVSNTGRLPIRMPRTRWLFPDEEPLPLRDGYTPLFIRGSRDREHLLETYVVGWDGGQPATQHGALTQPPKQWHLNIDERLLLVVLGQRYLLHEANPQPVSRQQAAETLTALQPDVNWSLKRVEHMVAEVRARLSTQGVFGLLREEVGEPVGNALNHNLLSELVLSTTLVPTDLTLLHRLSEMDGAGS
jgi:hypothetical protein